YAGDVEAERTLFAVVRLWLVGIAIAEGWTVVRGRPTISNIAALAVLDVVRPNICGRCRGVGHVKGRACSACSGVGIRRLSGRQIAKAIGVDESRYRRVWRERCQRCLSHVQELDSAVLSLLKHADRAPVGCHHRIEEVVL
ncbi:MAG: hypothetical protein IBX56_02440, partial [Methylomicrobium sp.]|nr:hypothetical protein [Methylomicrobium sp.]